MQKEHKFTIVIPTRNRADTLKWALKTCLTQNYNNFEVIVSDNFSEDHTKAIVEEYNDHRIKYVNTGQFVSMTHNFEFALSHVSAGYVSFIGDDDGLMPNALKKANKILQHYKYDAIIGKSDLYLWNDHNNPKLKGTLHLEVKNASKKIESQKMIKNVLSLKRSYKELPGVYAAGFVSYEVINKIKNKTNNFFFNSSIPDVYSSFALGSTIHNYLLTNDSFILSGASFQSNGTAFFNPNGKREIVKKFFTEDLIPFHKNLIMCQSMAILNAESYLQAKDRNLFQAELSMEDTIETAFKELVLGDSKIIFENTKKTLLKLIELNNLGDQFKDEMLKKYQFKNKFQIYFNRFKNKFIGTRTLMVKTDLKKIKNIYDATIYLNNIYECKSVFKLNTAFYLQIINKSFYHFYFSLNGNGR